MISRKKVRSHVLRQPDRFNGEAKVVVMELQCRCGSWIRLEGSDLIDATRLADGFVDPNTEPDDDDYWLERLDGPDETLQVNSGRLE